MSYFCSRKFTNQPPVKHSIKTFTSLYFITLYTLRHYRPAPNVTATLTRQYLEAAVYCSKNDRLHGLQILICLCGRSIEQVRASVLDPCGILSS